MIYDIFTLKEIQSLKNIEFNENKGENNTFEIDSKSSKIKKLILKLNGSNNKITINQNSTINISLLHIEGEKNQIHIGSNCKITGNIVLKGNNASIFIGDYTTFKKVYLLADESKSIKIGKDCMLSSGVMIRTSDSHSIIDLTTGKRKNIAEDVEIKNHVWIGMNAVITKGSILANDCVVATCSVVTKKFIEPNCTIGGIPAKVLNKNINWDRKKI